MFEVGLEAIETAGPEVFVIGKPFLRCPETGGIEADHAATSFAFAADQFGAFEHVEVLGDGSERHAVGLGDLADCLLAAGNVAEDGAAGSVGQRVEDGIKCGRCSNGGATFNHVVECSASVESCQPVG